MVFNGSASALLVDPGEISQSMGTEMSPGLAYSVCMNSELASRYRLPSERYLTGAWLGSLRFKRHLPILVEEDDDGRYLATDTVFGMHGEGMTPQDAEGDLMISLTEYYESVSRGAKEDPVDEELLDRLNLFLEIVFEPANA